MTETIEPLCDVCSRPITAGQQPRLLGSCEFPYSVHEECWADLDSVADFMTELCALSDEQPDGLFSYGRSPAGEPTRPEGDGSAVSEPSETDQWTAAVESYMDGGEPTHDRLNAENSSLYVDGYLPMEIDLGGTRLVRTDEGPPGLRRAIARALRARGLRPAEVDELLLDSVSVQRVGLSGARWAVWASDDETAAAAIAAVCTG